VSRRRQVAPPAPGARVKVRDEEWLVTKVDTLGADGQQAGLGYTIHVTGLSELVRDHEAIFLDELDEIRLLEPEDTAVVPDPSPRFRRSRLYLEALLRRTPPTDARIYLGHRGVGPEDVAWMLAVVPLARVVTPPLWGWVADRVGSPVPVLRGLALTAALGSLGYGLAAGPQALFAVLFLQGVFHASMFPVLDACGLALVEAHGAEYGEVRASGSLGFLVGVGVAGLVLEGSGMRWAPAGLGLACLGVAAGAWGLPALRAPPAQPLSLRSLGELLRIPALVGVYLATFAHEVAHCGYDFYFVAHVQAQGHSTALGGAGWALGVAAEVLLLRRSRSLLERFGPRTLMLLGVGLAALRWAVIAAAEHPAALVLLQLAHAFTFGAWFVGGVTLVDRLAPTRLRASAQGLFFASIFGLGAALGARLWGGAVARVGTAAAFEGMAVVEVMAFAATWFLVPRQLPERVLDSPAPPEGAP